MFKIIFNKFILFLTIQRVKNLLLKDPFGNKFIEQNSSSFESEYLEEHFLFYFVYSGVNFTILHTYKNDFLASVDLFLNDYEVKKLFEIEVEK